jgi:hypothetical protein
MKNRLRILSALVISLSIVSAPSHSAVKNGTSCPKLGIFKDVSGVRYKCVQSGKKLVWTVSKSASKNASPSASLSKIAFDEVQKLVPTNAQIRLTFETSKTMSPSFLNLVTNLTESSAKKFAPFLDVDFPVTIYVYSELDQEIIRKNPILSGQEDTFRMLDWYAKDKKIKNNSIGIAGHTYRVSCGSNQQNCSPLFNAAGAAYPSYSNSQNQNKGNTTTVPHELFHVIQDVYMYENLGSSYYSDAEKWRASQTIFREGSATFMQCAASFSNLKDYEECLDEKRNWLKNDAPKFKGVNSAQALTRYLTDLESTQPSAPHYFLGAAFTEWLIAKQGMSKFLALVKNHSIKKDFKDVFESVYGFSLVKAYEDSGSHIFERAK